MYQLSQTPILARRIEVSQAERYSRQTRCNSIGSQGQTRLAQSRVLLVGLGALGSNLADTLTRAGVGELILVDRDVVELSNLQRQVLYDEADAIAGRPKAIAAAQRLAQINSEVSLKPVCADFTPKLFEGIDGSAQLDLILDGTDNFSTRYLLNDLAMRHQIPWIYGGVVGTHGTAMVIVPGQTPCLRCLIPEPPATGESETCETAGVLLPAVQAITAFQAAEALKILTGATPAITRGIMMMDSWDYRHSVHMQKAQVSAHCPTCRGESFPALEADWSEPVSLCGRDAVQVQPRGTDAIDLSRLADNLASAVESLQFSESLLRFEVDACRFSVFQDGRALIFGISDPQRARTLYDRYIGA